MLSNYHVDNETYEDWSGGTAGYERLKVPTVWYMDGPQGFRDEKVHGSSTALPSCEQMAASWDRELVEQWGEVLGKESKLKGGSA